MVGQTLAHYKIAQKIGSGGMGDVYLAEDTKLDRNVALKVLPPELAASDERRARFEREAKALAALNHPNIITVHSVEEAEGVHFITMELVEGKTLAELLPKKGFSLGRFLDIAVPLADAIAAAHEHSIIHRDLKPGNVMVTDDGRTKVLDFGLARTAAPLKAAVDSESPTDVMTREGTLAGTLHYMSPEQAEGITVDTRSDIFSLGVVFFELLTGERPFQGDSPASTLSAVLKDEPQPIHELRPKLPRDLARIVRRCLVKDPEKRFQTSKDVRNELEDLKERLSSEPAEVTSPRRGLPTLLGAAALVALAALAVYGLRDQPAAEDRPNIRVSNAVQVTGALGVEDYPVWSPDGRNLAYASTTTGDLTGGNWDILVTPLGSPEPLNRTADHEGEDRYPSWSPDGDEIAFWSDREGGGVFVMSALAGAPRKITSAFSSAPRWSPDGSKLACIATTAEASFVRIVSLPSLDATELELPGLGPERHDLNWSPSGRLLAYNDGGGNTADESGIWVLRLEDGEAFRITDGRSKDWSPTWLRHDSPVLFTSNREGSADLWARELEDAGTPIGDAVRITTGVNVRHASFSRDGTKLAYSQGRRVSNVWRVPILEDRVATWGDAEQVTFDQAFIEFLDVSPDGNWVVISSDRGDNQDLWKVPTSGGEMIQLTTDPATDLGPAWSHDGTEIAFYSTRTGQRQLYVVPAEGGAARRTLESDRSDWSPRWSNDGKRFAFFSDRTGNFDVWVADSDGSNLHQITNHAARDLMPVWTSTGDIIFSSDRDGARLLYRVSDAGGEPENISDIPASYSRASRDGKTVFWIEFGAASGNIWGLSQRTGAERRMTDLERKGGNLGTYGLAVTDSHFYFAWEEDRGDIWVMDVVTDTSE